ncbi:MAG: hypothetical protein IIA59_12080 [Candidatus Marinimicrobia bacterium]|nr:hypothetical protein [Candidatus Neomarinimicrobiota bacterium]
MPISMPTGWRESAKIGRQVIGVCRLYYGDETNYIALSTHPIALGGIEHSAIMEVIPAVDYGVNMFTHETRWGNLVLTMANQGLSDLLESLGTGGNLGFENRKCEIRLATAEVEEWVDCLEYYSGVVRRVEHSYERVEMEIESSNSRAYLDLPRTEVTASAFPNTPTVSIGKFIPITIGSIDYAPGVITDNTSDIWTSSYPVVRFDDTSFAVNGLKGFNTISSAPHSQGPLFVWTGRNFIPARTDSDKRYTHGSTQLADCRIDFSSTSINVLGEIYCSTAASDWDGANPERVTDGSFTPLGSLKPATPANWSRTITLVVPDQGKLGSQKLWSVYAFARVDLATDANATATLKLYDNGGASSVTLLTVPVSTNTTWNNMTPASEVYTTSKLGDYSLTGEQQFYYEIAAVKSGSPSWNVNGIVYELALVILGYESDHSRLDWFGKIDGRKDDGSGTYTGTASALIETPTDAIMHIATNDLAISDIDAASFASARSVLSAWKHGYSQSGRISSQDLFANLGYQSKSFSYFGADQKFKVVTVGDTYESSDRSIDFSAVQKPVFKRSDLRHLYTNVVIHYSKNYATGEYASLTSGSDATQQTRYNVTESQSTLEVKADAIRDAATAGLLRDYLLKQWKQPHNLFEGTLPVEHLDLDIGDVLELYNVPFLLHGEDITINNTRNGQTIYKYWWIYNVTRSSASIKIKAIQLHDIS